MKFAWPSVMITLIIASFFLSVPHNPAAATTTILDDYVHMPDSNYGWTLDSTTPISGNQGVIYNLTLTSQQWRSPDDVTRHTWQHTLNIAVPNNANPKLALLIVEGGSNTSPPMDIGEYSFVAPMLGATIALLQHVPNQPLRFYNPNTLNISEDNAIAHTYDRYLNLYVEDEPHPDPTWPLLLPMVKSAVKAMDAIQECVAQHAGKNISEFIVGGASKRGWATWLTAAVDERVVGIVPLVIDILNMERQIAHHTNAYSTYPSTSIAAYMYGGYSTAIRPYTDRQIFDRMPTPEGLALRHIVDPYLYRDRLTMPKLIVNSTGDQFFLPDGIMFYFDQMPGKNYLYYAANTDHGLGIDLSNFDVILGLFTFVKSFYDNAPPLPEYSWSFEADGSIRIETEDTPYAAWLWQAHTPTHRDFRLQTMGQLWQKSALVAESDGVYSAQVPSPATGWTGFYVQLDFMDISLCTGLRVLPESYANGAAYPDVQGPQFDIEAVMPNIARMGTEVAFTVVASETLAEPPLVQVHGNAATLQAQGENTWLYTYVVSETTPDGDAPILVSGEDLWDNPGSALFTELLTIDTVPPQCLDVVITPASARPGDVVVIAFAASEPLIADPTVLVNNKPAVLFVEKSLDYSYHYTVSPNDPLGLASISITLEDLVGNTNSLMYTAALLLQGALPLHIMPALLLIPLAGIVILRKRRKQ